MRSAREGGSVDAMTIITTIVAENPGSNQSQVIELAKPAGISKHQVEKCLKDARFHCERGKHNELRYTLAPDQFPGLPVPKERETGELPAATEEVA